MQKVWFQLIVVIDDKEFPSTSVTLKDDDCMADLRDAVKDACKNQLQYVAAMKLKVYPPGTVVPVLADTEPCPVRDKVSKHPMAPGNGNCYIVVAPSRYQQQQRQGNLRM